MKKLTISELRENLLYTYELAGKSYDDKGEEYELVIVTRWSDRTEKAKEIGRKCFYFEAKRSQIEKLLATEAEIRSLFYNSNYARFGVIERLEMKRIY